MPKTFEGTLIAANARFAIVVSRWNSFITSKLLEGCVDALTRHGAADDAIEVVWVPGTWEMPLAVQEFIRARQPDAVICLGAILQGATPHAEHLSAEVAKGLASLSVSSHIPIAWGVLTCNTIEQAIERAGTKMGNKGAEAAISVIEMVNALRAIREGGAQ